jgi:PBP1b-binding outer membrane lipoprotein LpoB
MKSKILALFLISVIIAGCSSQTIEKKEKEEEQPTPSSKQVSVPVSVNLTDIPSDTTTDETQNTVIPAPRERGSEEKLIHNVSLDLSERLNIDISKVHLTEIISVSWEDTSLGCPVEGKTYTQEKIDGYKITLEVSNKYYVYHSKGLEDFVLCDN